MGVQINGSTGAVTGTQSDWSGNVSIGGTLTYEDVTNIDSVGLITARSGIEIGASPGVGASISVDGNAIFSGITTFVGSLKADGGVDASSQTVTVNQLDLADTIVHGGDTNTKIRFPSADTITAETAGSERARITSGGNFGIGSNNPQVLLHIASATPTLRIQDTTNNFYSHISVDDSGSLTLDGDAGNGAGSSRIVFKTDGSEHARIDSSGRLLVGATAKRNVLNQNGNSGGDSTTPLLYAEGLGDSKSLTIVSNNTNAWRGSVLGLARTRGTSLGASTIIADDDNIGQIVFAAADGTDIESNVATISAWVDGTPGANDTPGRLVFSTTDDGAVVATEKARITAAGRFNLGDRTTSPDELFHMHTASGAVQALVEGASNASVKLVAHNGDSTVYFGDAGGTPGWINYDHGTDSFSIKTNSGNPGYELKSDQQSFFNVVNSYLKIDKNNTGVIMEFVKSGSQVGNIGINNSSTTYNTSSDYRLKENILDLTGAITRLKQLKPKKFNFIKDPDIVCDGFIAHEASEVIPHVVTGQKDGDEMQTMDYGKLTPLLTAALQEAIAEIETLKTEVAALKSS